MSDVLPHDDHGRGIPIVFLHAFPLSRRMWDGQKSEIARHFRFLSFDFPGFGDSKENVGTLTMESAARRVLESLTVLKINEPAVFVGLSMGGYILLQLHRLAPERVRAAAFVATRSAADTPTGRDKRLQTIVAIEKEGIGSFAERTAQGLLGPSAKAGNPALVRSVTAWSAAAAPNSVIAALRGMAERPDTTESLPSITVPSLVLAGADDAVIPTAEMESMSKRLPASEFHVVPASGHLVNLEQPAVFLDRLAAFLKRRVL